MEILNNISLWTHSLRCTVERLTIHKGIDVVIIAEINVVPFITALSHLLRSLIKGKLLVSNQMCVKKSKMEPNDAAAVGGWPSAVNSLLMVLNVSQRTV